MDAERYNLMRKIAYSAITDTADRLARLSQKLEHSRNWNDLTDEEQRAISEGPGDLESHNVVAGTLHSVAKLLEVEQQVRDIVSTFESRYEW